MAYLLEHPNRHATAAGYDGFWGHPTRLGADVRLVVIHTSESAFDTTGTDGGAEAVAGYLSRTDRPASYHRIVDADSTVELLPFSHTAFGARGHNRHAIHLAVAGVAAGWTTLAPSYRDRVLDRLADAAADALAWADLPAERVVGGQARVDGRGLCGHVDLDPDRRTDPGPRFPWDLLIDRIKDHDMATTSNPGFQASFDKAVDVGMFSQHTRPGDELTAEKLAVFLDRAGLLDRRQATAVDGHKHTVRVTLE